MLIAKLPTTTLNLQYTATKPQERPAEKDSVFNTPISLLIFPKTNYDSRTLFPLK